MRKILLLGVLLLTLTNIKLSAQASEMRSTNLGDRLWYGMGLTGNFQGNNFSRTFVIGLAPMVGYKINERLSFGPRASAAVSFFRSRLTPTPQSESPVDWSFGLFGRYRIGRDFFAHVEYAYQNEAFIAINFNGDLEVDREVNQAFYVGGGYTTLINDYLGFEMSLNYYLNQPFDDFRNPLNYRFGVNYRF